MSIIQAQVVDQLLDSERENTRLWLRCRMDFLVDPLVDELFHKLKRDLTASLKDDADGNVKGQDSHLILSSHEKALNRNNHEQSSKVSLVHAQTISNSPNIIIKEEFYSSERKLDFVSITNQASSSAQTNEQWNNKTKEEDGINSGDYVEVLINEDNLNLYEDDETIIDSDVEYIDEMDNGEGTGGDEKMKSRPTKRPRTDDDDKQRNTQFITLGLQCIQPKCVQSFGTKKLLHAHMKEFHRIDKFQCAVKNCSGSFDSGPNLGKHIKATHSDLSTWECDQCPAKLSKYRFLHTHIVRSHQLGKFQCAFADCRFIGKLKNEVYSHHKRHIYRPAQDEDPIVTPEEYTCKFPDCIFHTKSEALWRQHERTHLGIKPYRCKWPSCGFSALYYGLTLSHIRGVHFTRKNVTSQSTEPTGIPKDYIQVVHDLF